MDLSNLTPLIKGLESILVGGAAIFAFLMTTSKKFRALVNKTLKDTESMKSISKKLDNVEETTTALKNTINKMDKSLDNMHDRLEQDKASTLLTLKYEILDICHRADKYGGITQSDKSLLCEMYHEYVDVWKENHYVKSTAIKVIENTPIISQYPMPLTDIDEVK